MNTIELILYTASTIVITASATGSFVRHRTRRTAFEEGEDSGWCKCRNAMFAKIRDRWQPGDSEPLPPPANTQMLARRFLRTRHRLAAPPLATTPEFAPRAR